MTAKNLHGETSWAVYDRPYSNRSSKKLELAQRLCASSIFDRRKGT